MVTTDVLLRAGIALGIGGAGLILYMLANRVILTRARQQRRGLETLRPGVPAILYFTTPDCVPCRTRQRPALRALQAELGEAGVQIIEVDASSQPDLADCWGVLSVPTTFILDSSGHPRRINHGVQGTRELSKQIREVELSLDDFPRSVF